MAVFPEPPFFYKLLDDPDSAIYKELTTPPSIPPKRIIFGEEETDEIPKHSIDEKKDSIVTELQALNGELLSKFIDILYVIQQPEYHLIELKQKQQTQSQEEKRESANENETLIQNANTLTEKPFEQMMHGVFEPSQLVPIINDRCESLKVVYRSMRDILNSMRPQQANETLIQTLQKQMHYKQNKLNAIRQNIASGQRILNQKLNVAKKKDSEDEHDLFLHLSTDNNHTQESIIQLKQTLDDAFFD